MSYIVLARKWRPMVFEEVIGQEHITTILTSALKNQRIAHAYIFAGPRGVGKTSTARLLAKAVNCEKAPVVNPCNECAICKSITDGHSLDVIEIDGASNRGIDEIRNLRENIRFAPAASRYKIYIIDEVHMLTKEAFNALLKTLEEPPSHAIFIFATTEIHRVPLTILSRCQRFDFKRISVAKIKEMLQKIIDSENIKIDEEALLLIARKADGSMRDGESILDQMISFSNGELTVEEVRNSLGLIDQDVYFEFTDLFSSKTSASVLEYAGKIINSGHDLIDFLHGLQDHFRNFLITGALQNTRLLDVADHYKKRYEDEVNRFSDRDIIHYLQILSDTEQQLKYSAFPELSLEMLLLKLIFKPASVDLEKILALLDNENPNSASGQNEPSSEISNHPTTSEQVKNSSKSKTETSPPLVASSDNKRGYVKPSSVDKKNDFLGLEASLRGLQDMKNSETTGPKTEETVQISLEDIKQKWDKIIEIIRTQKVALASFLEEGIPYEVDKGRLIVAYDRSAGFHQEHVEKNSKTIEKILRNDCQLPIRIGFTSIDFQKEGIKKQPRTPEEIVEDIKNKEPVIKKIIDMFDLDESTH
jgi:DNA polymerase-3 subunit gamma/tau